MKKLIPIIIAIVSIYTLVNASVWEGAAAIAGSGELPDNGLYMATNSFPGNTVVDVTNLENGRTIRVIVSSGLDTPGLLALLSKDAADSIGLQGRTLGRIRMSQPADPIAFSRFAEGRAYSSDPDYDPSAFVALNDYDLFPVDDEEAEADLAAGSERIEGGDLIVDLPDNDETVPEYAVIDEIPELTLAPAETRPPERGPEPDSAYFIPAIEDAGPSISTDSSSVLDPSLFVDPIVKAPTAVQQVLPSSEPLPLVETMPLVDIQPPVETMPLVEIQPLVENPPLESFYIPSQPEQLFSAPLIGSLEKGRYYLQIAAYSRVETVQSEITKIDSNLPVAIMNAGSEEKPVYRILIGPVNLGESGALLQRFKINYKDAFIRLGT